MNWGEIRALARVKLGDPDGKVWTNAELLIHGNDTHGALTVDCESTIKHYVFSLTSGTRLYSLPSDFYELRGVWVDGRKINGRVSQQMEEVSNSYLTDTGTIETYYLEDLRTIAFWRVPSWTADYEGTFTSELGMMNSYVDGSTTATFSADLGVTADIVDSTGSQTYNLDSDLGEVVALEAEAPYCVISYVYEPQELTADADIPDMPDYMHYAMVYGVVARATAKDGQGKNPKISNFYMARYKELADEWRNRNLEWRHTEHQLFTQQSLNYGNDMDWRARMGR